MQYIISLSKSQELTIDKLVEVCKDSVGEEHLPSLLEGFIELFFSNKLKEFDWLLHLADESADDIPEMDLFKRFLPKSVIKYFLRHKLSKSSQQPVDPDNILSLYDNKVCYCIPFRTNY